MRGLLAAASLAAAFALLAAGCGGSNKAATSTPAATPATPATPTCAHPAGWRRLADKIHADVYCPGWLPDPLTSLIGGPSNNIDSVSRDRSYLESFIWQDTDSPALSGELHVILRGYPARTAIPTCLEGLKDNVPTPCFAGVHGTVTENGIKAKLYTVNQDADEWHLLLLWRHKGGLYTVSEHLAPPLDYRKDVAYLEHELGSLVLIPPSRST